MTKKFSIVLYVVLGLLLTQAALASESSALLVLGVIASGDADDGVALIKRQSDGKTTAVRVGHEIAPSVTVFRVTREYVYLQASRRIEKVKVGEELPARNGDGSLAAQSTGIEREGNVVRLTSSFREHVVRTQLSKVLMQAAAVPYYVEGNLQGFRLWDIDEGSLYDQAGFANGDLITAINGTQLTDVSQTIRTLQALREEPRADVTYVRKGLEQTLQIVIQ